MADLVPCPNRACNAVFSADSLRGATRFVCPRCGKTFRSSAAPPPLAPGRQGATRRTKYSADAGATDAAAASVRVLPDLQPADEFVPIPEALPAEPPIPPKSAAKVIAAPPHPAESSTESAAPAFVAAPRADAAIIRLSTPRRRSVGSLVASTVVLVLAAGAAACGCWWLFRSSSMFGNDSSAPTVGAYSLAIPDQAWKKDPELQMHMQVNRAARRSRPTAALAFFAHDYKTRLPTESEMIDAGLEKLHYQFKRLEWERSAGESRLGGQPALALNFDATDAQDVDVRGVAYLLAYRGFGYWLFLWSPAVDGRAAAGELERIRSAFALNPAFREGWQAKSADTETLAIREAGLTLAVPKSVWVEEDKAGYDPKAVRVLKGTFPVDGSGKQRDRHAGRVAIAQVLVLENSGPKSIGETARDYVLEAAKDAARGNYANTTLSPIKDKAGEEQDRDADIGKLHGRLIKLKMANTEDRVRYVVLGVVPAPGDRSAVIWCECDWSVREYWDQEFGVLLTSLTPFTDGEKAKNGATAKSAE